MMFLPINLLILLFKMGAIWHMSYCPNVVSV
jgi:hypothetical protein